MGAAGRKSVCARWSLDQMVEGYHQLISNIYVRKTAAQRSGRAAPALRLRWQRTARLS
jgi:hypothetical protein